MTPEFQNYLLAAPPPTFQPPRLAIGSKPRDAGHLPNAPAAPPTSLPHHASHPPAHPHTHVADYAHGATQAASFVTSWTPHRLQRLKTHCKKAVLSLIGAFRGQSRREKSTEDAATLSTVTPKTILDKPYAYSDAIQSDTIQSGAVHDYAIQSDASQDLITPNNTWNVPINIFYAMSACESDIRRSAIGRFDSQSSLDLMSSTYAERSFGIRFDNTAQVPIGETITGEVVYSIGKVYARWAPLQDVTLSSSSGDKITVTAKTHYATFYVIVSDRFDVYIGHPSLEINDLYGEKPKLLNPFRSYGSTAGPTGTSTSAQDEEYLRRMEAERLAVAQFTQQQTQGTSKK